MNSNNKKPAGSAYLLNGKIYILTVFISKSDWIYDAKIALYNKIYEAEKWIVKQAEKYSATLEFEHGCFGLDETIIIDDIYSGTGSGKEPVDIVKKTFKKVGYKSNESFLEWVKENTDCTGSLVLIVANQKGRGYALPYSDEMSAEDYFLEGCMIYSQEEDGSPVASATIAHEILHLFGAWDLYETFEQTKENEEKAKQLFPDDIMLRTSYNIEELSIDPLTAWLAGLSPNKEEWYEGFRPKA